MSSIIKFTILICHIISLVIAISDNNVRAITWMLSSLMWFAVSTVQNSHIEILNLRIKRLTSKDNEESNT